MKAAKLHLKSFIGMLTISSLIFACTESSFTGGNALTKKPASKIKSPTTGTTVDLPKGSLLSDQRKVEASNIHRIWTVETNGTAKQITLEGDTIKEIKKWKGILGDGGTRTYVTEGGFVAARYPNIYFIDPEKTPQDTVPETRKVDTQGLQGVQRICLASYVKNNKRYVFAAYGDGTYWDIPLSDEKPYQPLWDNVAKGTIKSNQWGYSCYIDQVNNIFYSQWIIAGNITAINLNTLTQHNSGAKNHNFVSTSFPLLTQSSKSVLERLSAGISYSITGDSEGNAFNGTDIYTMSVDSSTDSVYISSRAGPNLGGVRILPRECLVSKANCTGMSDYQRAPTNIGPMSALKDGRIVGLTRTTGQIYILSLKDKNNRAAGFNAALLKESAGGDPYMYNDFTGATLYVREAAQEFDMSKQAGYKAGKPNISTVFTWKSKSGANKPWKDIKLEIRCYQDQNNKPGYEEVKTVGDSDKYTDISVSSCANKPAKFVEAQVTQLNSSTTLTDIEFLQVAIKQ